MRLFVNYSNSDLQSALLGRKATVESPEGNAQRATKIRESRLNLDTLNMWEFSTKFNFILLLIHQLKLAGSLYALINAHGLCLDDKEIWLLSMSVYDFTYILFIIYRLIHVRRVQRLVKSFERVQDPNNEESREDKTKSIDERMKPEPHRSSVLSNNFSVRQSHERERSSLLCKHTIVWSLSKVFVIVWIGMLCWGQFICIFTHTGICTTKQIETLIWIFLIFGYVWLVAPALFIVISVIILLIATIFGSSEKKNDTRESISLTPQRNRSSAKKVKACCFCDEEYKSTDRIVSINCRVGHTFHMECVNRWFEDSKECPVCESKKTHSMTLPAFTPVIQNSL